MKKHWTRPLKRAAAALLSMALVVSPLADFASMNTVQAEEATITITESEGYAEGAYVEWSYVDGANGYRVKVSKDQSTWTQLDDELIRNYGSYMRADALGLTAGTWYVQVEAGVYDSSKNWTTTLATITQTVTVTAHDRSGYAWENNGTASGAYNEDGSLKSNAVVLYITQGTKDSVAMSVVTSSNGSTTNATGLQNILAAYQKGYDSRPLAIRLIGNITDFSTLDKGDIVIKGCSSGVTFEGVGEDATCNGWGLRVVSASNVEVRNLGFMNCNSNEGDNVGIESCQHVWVHHCDMFYGDAGSDADQAKGDGALDTKKSMYITHSYNHFWDNGKCNLQGSGVTDTSNYITYHHNWYDHSDSRHPRIRVATVHVYNNYYDGNAKYGVGATTGASVFVENNYFRNCSKPMMISEQGSDTTGTLSDENGGIIKAYGNYITGADSYIPYSQNSSNFDCYDASGRDEQVPSSVVAVKGGATYNNFDTASDFYDYILTVTENVPSVVEANAGRVNGGDFKWTFNDSEDDNSSVVDTELKSLCTNYSSSLVSVGGYVDTTYYTVTFDPANGEATSSVQVMAYQTVAEPAAPTVIPEGKASFDGWYNGETKWNFSNPVTGDMTLTGKWLAEGENPGEGDETFDATPIGAETVLYDITKDGLTNAYFVVSGNLKSSEGTSGTYNGTSFTGKGLKMESETSITFKTTTAKAKVVMLFDNAFAKGVKVDGTKHTVTAGVVEVDITAAGIHTITKGDSTELYAIYVIPEGSAETPATEYTITVDLADGSATTSFKVTAGNAITTTELPTPTREGYSFVGWVDGSNNAIVLPYTPIADMTITATWQQSSPDGDDVTPGTGDGNDTNTPGTGDGNDSPGTGDGNDTPGKGDGDDKKPVNNDGLKVVLANPGEKYVYTGSAIKPAIIVTNNGEKLVAGVDYTVKYSNNVNASVKKDATITVTGKGNLTGSNSTTFKILPKDIADSDVVEGAVVVVKGSKAKPILLYNNKKLAAKDFDHVTASVKYTETGRFSAPLLGKGNFTGERSVTVWVVEKQDLKKFTVTVGKEKLTYNGEEQMPAITVTDKDASTPLKEGEDYEIVYSGSKVNAGTVKFTVIGLGLYSGTVSKSYKIAPLAVKDGSIKVTGVDTDGYEFKAKGVTIGDDLTVTYKDEVLRAGKDYKVTYSGNKKVGTAKYTVTFLGNYKGSTPVKGGTFKINPAPLSDDLDGLKIMAGDKVYSGKPNVYKSIPLVSVDGVLLKKSDYTVTYYKDAEMKDEITGKNKVALEDGQDSVTVYVKLEGKGNYVAANGVYATATYEVCKKPANDLSKARVTFVDASGNKLTKAEYTGNEIEPAVKVEIKNGKTWTVVPADKYEVTYFNNVNKGTASVVVTATGEDYAGSKTAKFKIVAKNLKSLSDLLKDLFGL